MKKEDKNLDPVVEEVKDDIKPAYPHESLQKIEDERLTFLRVFKFNNSMKIVVAVLCIALIIVGSLVVPSIISEEHKSLSTTITVVSMVLGLGIMLGYSFFTKRAINKKMRAYFNLFYACTNEFVFDNNGFNEAKLQEPGKIDLDRFNECHLYKDVIEVGSRGLTEFVYNKIPMTVVDCAGNVKGEKRIYPVFVGKYLCGPAKYDGADLVIIYLKGNDRALPPTNLEGIKKVVEDEKYDIYSNSKNWKKVLSDSTLKVISSLKTNNLLVDVAINVEAGKTHVMLGYDDPLMVLPLQTTFNSAPIEQYKKELAIACKVVEALNK